jgi:hypothetical protein
MRRRAAVLSVIAFAGVAASAEAATIIDLPTNAITSGSPTQASQLQRDGTLSTCAAPKSAAPPLSPLAGPFHHRNHTFRSFVTNPVCVTVSLNPACGGSNAIFSAAYAGAFDAADPRTRYAADLGSSISNTGGSYSFSVGGESQFSVVVHEAAKDAGCANYGLTLASDRPWASTAPIVGGDPRLGGTLTAGDANWATAPSAPTVERRWQRCDDAGGDCVDIPGATATAYTVAEADIGSTLRFVNVATDGGSSTSRSRTFEAYIPFDDRSGEALGTGDRFHAGTFVRTGVADHCATPGATTLAILNPFQDYLFDSFPVTSLLNEPTCLVVRTVPACLNGVTPEIYTPSFTPADGVVANHSAHSGENPMGPNLTSWRLPPGGNAEAVVSRGFSGGGTACASYDVTLGADAPFASARPAISGTPVEGGTLTATDGAWSGSPSFGYSWLRCDGDGAACSPIDAATGSSYSPTAADVGRRLRARVTATRGRSVSSDSEPSDVVVAAPVPPVLEPDRIAPTGTLRLGSRNLTRALKRRRIPVVVTCDEQCAAAVRVRITRKLAKRLRLGNKVVIARATGTAGPGKLTTLRAKLTKRARRALRDRRSLRVALRATVTDVAGNAAQLKTAAALRRPR